MDFYQRIFKKDSKGKIRQLTVSALNGELVQSSGLLGGAEVEHRSLATAKNVGRSNETTAQEQAVKEAHALIEKKLKEGYHTTQVAAETSQTLLPMLAYDIKKYENKVEWGHAYLQPKLDGMRCLSTQTQKISRKNRPIETMGHIDLPPEGIVDGELYVHGKSFQENMKLIKKYREGESEHVRYWVYDMVSDKPFPQRMQILHNMHKRMDKRSGWVVTPTYKVNSWKEVNDLHQKFIQAGYEGSILRWGEEGYVCNKRSKFLLKKKDFIDEAYRIVDVEPSKKDPEQGIFICEGGAGRFGCGMKFSHEERKEILQNKENYINKTAEIRFFEYTDDGLPRFPVCVGIRLDK